MELKNQQTTNHQSFGRGSTTSAQPPFHYSLRPRRDHPPPNPDPAPPPAAVPAAPSSPVRYRECLKNHAVKSGGHGLDGCGEFMPSGEDGTPDAFKCAACECHRSFHRRVLEADIANGRLKVVSYGKTTEPSPYSHINHRKNNHSPPRGPIGPVMMAFGGLAEAPAESSSDGAEASRKPKKRLRTKFSGEQKAKMIEFAKKLGMEDSEA